MNNNATQKIQKNIKHGTTSEDEDTHYAYTKYANVVKAKKENTDNNDNEI